MTDRPILFSSPMVRALLAGQKTQTRRVLMKTRNGTPVEMHPDGRSVPFNDPKQWGFPYYDRSTDSHDVMFLPDYVKGLFKVGDRLWVREAWRTTCNIDGVKPRFLDAGHRSKVTFEADPENRNPLWAFGRLRPGMHMPRWASRLTLTVTDVRVQRLQEISEADAIAEGLRWRDALQAWTAGGDNWPTFLDPRRSYAGLWNHLNAERGFGWETNPWVVAVSFTADRRNIDAVAA
ncbi:hypothetical protein [Mesorhizobium sp.]|uniref:hypothetical protein n=1 Tax=Mesorhizobium sp. TaxID=1871066 RepID=UPI000FE652EA|nr:hypothetical protein [Mesorhizobium sp.]RWH31600.1 MAG: hypothetical protein EOQ76_07230 [Mesorhizobium sp.]TIR57653.1 MAG: hypothetical protein E5X22_22780 [Mesorhizobium sp.]